MINLYYDNIIEGVPAPNGAKELALTKDARRVPYVKNHNIFSPISLQNTFYFVMKANKTVVNLYTEKQKSNNLFYPIELNDTPFNWDRDLTNLVSSRAKKMIQKGHMKLLILAPKVTGNFFIILQLKKRVQELVESGIPKESICLVLGELNRVYKNILELPNVYFIDYQQIYSQLLLKCRWGMSDVSWIFGYDTRAKTLTKTEIENEFKNVDNWNPNIAYDVIPSGKDHDVTLLLELLHRGIKDKGIYNFVIKDYQIKDLNNNYVNPKKSYLEKEGKLGFLKHLHKYSSDNYADSDCNSIISVICDDTFLNIDTVYKDELSALSVGHNVWKQIAQAHPFMVLGCVDTMAYLNDEGFFSCNELLDQRYDKIMHSTKRVEMICDNIDRILGMEETKLKKIIEESKPFLKRNQVKFFEKRQQPKFLDLFIDMRYE